MSAILHIASSVAEVVIAALELLRLKCPQNPEVKESSGEVGLANPSSISQRAVEDDFCVVEAPNSLVHPSLADSVSEVVGDGIPVVGRVNRLRNKSARFYRRS